MEGWILLTVIVIMVLWALFVVIAVNYQKKGFKEAMDFYLIKVQEPVQYRLVPVQTPLWNLEKLKTYSEYDTWYEVIAKNVTREEAEEIIKNLNREIVELGDNL